MSFEADEEILQDFLVEAGEILESLSEELVELENDIDNADLLNSIFRVVKLSLSMVLGSIFFILLKFLFNS